MSGYSQSQGGYAPPPPPRTVSKNIPIDLLTQILSERTGQNVQVGNIRTTIFDMFGEQASPSVKMFVNLALSQLQVAHHNICRPPVLIPSFAFAICCRWLDA